MKIFNVAFLFDKTNNWLFEYFEKRKFHLQNIKVSCLFEASEAVGFDVVFLLGYTTILPKTFLAQNDLTLVVHESALPKGKGFAPVQWQLLEGYSEITVSLIEAVEKCDSGDIFHQLKIAFDGTELYDEIREKQAIATIDIISEFLNSYPNVSRSKQIGEESFYPKRTWADGELDINKTIQDNFNLLRVGNNDAWPSFFYHKGIKYILKIFKDP